MPVDDTTAEDHDMIVESDFEEKSRDDVAIIGPPSNLDKMETQEKDALVKADDFDGMFKKLLPKNSDLETLAEGYFTWEIEAWDALPKRLSGPVFEVGGIPWRILFFPAGNNAEFTSLYLEHGFEDNKPPENWYSCVEFALVMWNPKDSSVQSHHHAHHRFNAEEGDWGFTRFYELRKLFHKDDKERPLVEDNKANITAYVRIVKDPTGVLWHNFVNYDSKKETGYVGLKNQGATCYLNSLIQSLYFTKSFRKAVYQIPTENEKTDNSALTLQRLFYLLQTSAEAISTSELTKSFGWETKHIFEQQDVQELSRILMERLEEKMKGTEAENSLAKMFVGKTKTYVSCINVDFESSRVEDFWDIQLNVRGFKNLDESFKDYIAEEILDGENKYHAEGIGLEDAKKGVIFESFPPILHMQLKRFEYDIEKDAMTKVNDHYEFPLEIDVSPYLSADADKSEPCVYSLHGVLVHSGDVNAGHYYAFLKPEKDGKWYKFDDDRVTPATLKEVLDENYGGDFTNANGIGVFKNPYARALSMKRSMSAYMLVYLRKNRLDEILPEVDFPPPTHLKLRLDEERQQREQKKKEREEMHLYLNPKVISSAQFQAHQGFDLAAWDNKDVFSAGNGPKAYKILKSASVRDLVKMVADDLEQDPSKVRLWVMVNRQNKTVRPDNPLANLEMAVEDASIKYGVKGQDFRLWAEVATGPDAAKTNWGESYSWAPNGQILIFLKHFNPDDQTLKGVTHVYMRKNDKVGDLMPLICNEMKWANQPNLKLYEEIKPQMIEPMKAKSTFQQAEIQDGDIICFQKTLSEKELSAMVAKNVITDAKDFYDYLVQRLVIKFLPRGENKEKGTFDLTLNKKMNYDALAAKVGEHLGVPGTHLRFHTIQSSTGTARSVLKRNLTVSLLQMLQSTYIHQIRNDALYYEILDVSLSEMETKKLVKIIWLPEGITKEEPHEILAPKSGNIQDVLEGLGKKLKWPEDQLEHIRVWETHASKFHKDLDFNFDVISVNEFVTIYAERVPEDDVAKSDSDRYIRCFHFQKEPNKPHSIPFKFVVKEGEIFKETKARLEKRTGIKGKVFEKIKFAVVKRSMYSKPTYLEDDDILSDIATDPEDLLGLDHVDKTPRGGFWGSGREQPIFIK